MSTTEKPGSATDHPTTTQAVPPGSRPHRVALVAGVAWLVCFLFSTTPEAPDRTTAGAGDIRAYVDAGSTTLTFNAVASVVGVVALLALLGAVSRILERARPGTVAAPFALVAGGFTALQLLLFTAFYGVWLFVPDVDDLPDRTITTLYDATLVADALGSLVLAVTCAMVGTVSWVALRARVVHRPVAWFGLAVSAAAIAMVVGTAVGSGAAQVAFYVALFGSYLWPVAIGIDLGVKGRTAGS
ncbi:hypothetical protein E8D34_00105 [Nocardioides sp. GY 10113]|uniref:hypothetical protein n=1 Tax=Nocardioides sp. GY 10113 TaxID=2569761 RepID=UPI0010A8AF8B|nr:hypothetical protein [Nocardioides sp. GY 10113]TIC88973.1 hypothetical protein E8D34_00105 [Nocardioides sp. GY 10113]